jgi:hypothetical protein
VPASPGAPACWPRRPRSTARAVGDGLIRRGRIPGLTYVPFYFTAMNVAAFLGLVRYINGRQGTQWRKAQR